VVPNAVDPARFPERPAPDGPFTAGFLGTLKPWHDVATLVEAVARLRAGPVADARLLVVGDGPERGALEARAAALGIADAVEFTGALAAPEVPDRLARMHAAAAPYRNGEPFYFSPLKLYEYMAARLPVVRAASAISAIWSRTAAPAFSCRRATRMRSPPPSPGSPATPA
jgi:glycosyltransferase involved in cell wall biosynthesis